MIPKWVSKRIKNRSKNMIDFLIDFEVVLEPPTPGEPPTTQRAGAVEGVGGGINPSPLGLRGGLVDLFVGFIAWRGGLHALRLSASADF